MTKSTITRERLLEIIVTGPEASGAEQNELARMALAAMDSKPDCKERKLFCSTDTARMRKVISASVGSEATPLCRHAQPAPVVLDGYVMVPMRLTAENGAKGALSGEFSETKFVNCPDCFGDDECETCDGSGRIEITVPVTWTTIKEIWAKGVEHFAAAPHSPGSDPATVPGKWIPVSERMPDVGDIVLTAMGGSVNVGEMERSGANYRYFTSVISGRELPVTHWMPLPAAPQEVKSES